MTETLRGAGGGRLPLLEVGEARRRAAEVGVPETMAELSVFRTLLHQPRAARAVNGLLHALLWKGTLDARLRELLIMRIGWTTGAVYEWTQHWAVALAAGVPEADVLGVRDWLNYEGFDDADRAVLAATDESLAAGCISDATWRPAPFISMRPNSWNSSWLLATGRCSPACCRASMFRWRTGWHHGRRTAWTPEPRLVEPGPTHRRRRRDRTRPGGQTPHLHRPHDRSRVGLGN